MSSPLSVGLIVLAATIMSGAGPGAVLARAPDLASDHPGELPAYMQCVPYARALSGIELYGDAYTWWDQAAGKFQRGREPRVGAVMAFIPTERMPLGHVATVMAVVDRRTILLDHANWSPIDGRRGQIERGVRAIDVSPANDWSEVRVWYHPLRDLGTTRWPVAGFIYADGQPRRALPDTRLANAALPAATRPSRDFSKAFADLGQPVSQQRQGRSQAVQQPSP